MAIQQILPPERLKDGKYVLDQQEEQAIISGWNSGMLDLKKLIEHVWPGQGFDGRSYQGRELKRFLATRNHAPRTSGEYVKKSEDPLFQLKEHEKEFIKNHASEMNWNPIAKRLWGDDIAIGDLRMKLCKEHFESLPPELLNPKYVMETKDYTPPKNILQVVARLRDYRIVNWDIEKLNSREKEQIKCLIKYAHTYRFVSEMNTLVKKDERQFCESNFIKWTFDKTGLDEEYVDMYINLCLSMLDTRRMRDELTKLIEIRDDELESSIASGKATVNMALIEGINTLRSEISSREEKQEKTINKLTGDRAKKMENSNTSNASLASLVELWKEKDKRDKIIKLAEERKKKLHDEMDRLGSLDALKFEAFGFGKEDFA